MSRFSCARDCYLLKLVEKSQRFLGLRSIRPLPGKTCDFPCDRKWLAIVIDLLMGLFRGAVFDHGGVPENCPLALMGRFPSFKLMGRFLSLMGLFPECLNGPFPS